MDKRRFNEAVKPDPDENPAVARATRRALNKGQFWAVGFAFVPFPGPWAARWGVSI
ncbi:hypothetical protein B0G38_004388, partial [Arthrobacter sp. VKM Ac-2550]|nr:hypothetical protein [Arthrobacter sp. VKM Ac-2550]